MLIILDKMMHFYRKKYGIMVCKYRSKFDALDTFIGSVMFLFRTIKSLFKYLDPKTSHFLIKIIQTVFKEYIFQEKVVKICPYNEI